MQDPCAAGERATHSLWAYRLATHKIYKFLQLLDAEAILWCPEEADAPLTDDDSEVSDLPLCIARMENVIDFGRCVLSPNDSHFNEFEVVERPRVFRRLMDEFCI